jgi:coatomer subunit beta'
VSKAVSAWRDELKAKNRPKVAAGIAHPDEDAALFTEGWDDVLKMEQEHRPTPNS